MMVRDPPDGPPPQINTSALGDGSGGGAGGGALIDDDDGLSFNPNDDSDDGIDPRTGRPFSDFELARQLLALVGPTLFMSLMGFGTQGITVAFVGHRLGSDALAHFSIGNSVFNMFGISIGYGLTAALDTLVSQSYGRLKQNSAEIGDYIQRATLINVALTVPIGALFTFGEPVYIALCGPDMGAGAAQYTRHTVPFFFLYLVANTIIKVLQAIDRPEIPFFAVTASTVCCVGINYVFVHDSFVTAAYAMTATYAVQVVMLLALCYYHPRVTFWRHCAWPSPRLLDWGGMAEYFAVGVPSLLACVAEWWAFEVLQVIVASMSLDEVAVLNITLNVSAMLYSICMGVSVAAAVKIGNSLGANKPTLARRFTRVSIAVNQTINALVVSLMLLFRLEVGAIFTSDVHLIQRFNVHAFVLAAYHWGDSTQVCLQGVFRGAGRQSQLISAVLLSLWVVGLPLSYVFGKLLHWDSAGIMAGLIVGFLVEIPVLFYYVSRWPWTVLAKQASMGTHEHGGHGGLLGGCGGGGGGGSGDGGDGGDKGHAAVSISAGAGKRQ